MENINGLKIIKNTDGQEMLFINSNRLTDCIEYLYSNDLHYIVINSFQDYFANDIDFLLQLKDHIEGLSILDDKFNLNVVNQLHNLKYLGFPDNGKDIIDLSNFPKLEVAGITLSPRLKGLELCENLRSLTISKYKSRDLSTLPSLLRLEHLSLIKPDILTIKGIEQFNFLKKIEIYGATKLEKIEMMTNLSFSIEEVQIEKCSQIKDYGSFDRMKQLKKLIILDSGQLESLSFVKNLPQLQFLSFYGTNVLDGKIEYCIGINYVGFDNKRHYTMKQEQFKNSQLMLN
ncbi:MAG: hypothetical protein WAS55_13225 [Saprospiraceae bacterium]